jgi:hypothetical protein
MSIPGSEAGSSIQIIIPSAVNREYCECLCLFFIFITAQESGRIARSIIDLQSSSSYICCLWNIDRIITQSGGVSLTL